MNKNLLKKSSIFILTLFITFFVNFLALAVHLIQCGLKHWPCYSESFDSPILTNHLNFFVEPICGGFSGECFPAHFSSTQLIADIIFALAFYFIILGIIEIIKKLIHKHNKK